MKTSNIILITMVFIIIGCNQQEKTNFAFYHWKSKANYSTEIGCALKTAGSSTVYMHYFDVDAVTEKTSGDHGLYPVYVLNKVDEKFKSLEVIPVVFIANKCLKNNPNLDMLCQQIEGLVNEINLRHFNKKSKKLQLDCDWTQATRESYFRLIELLGGHFEVSATIRLHQVKFLRKTGVPPVKKGVLMVYNIGKLENENQNSILNPQTLARYINKNTDYPIELEVALPMFSQTVIKSKDGKLRLARGVEMETIKKDKKHFRQTSSHVFEVVEDTLYKGFYLSEGYRLKLEKLEENDVVSAYRIIKNSKLDVSTVVFYHLDDSVLTNIDLDKIINGL